MMRRWVVVGALLVTVAVPVSAQIFGGIVYDPTNYANAVLRYGQLQAQLSQLITTYTQIRTQYLLLFEQAKKLPFAMAGRYLSLRTPWKGLGGVSVYGTTAPWILSANTGTGPLAAFTKATELLGPYGPLTTLSAAEIARLQTRVDRTQLQGAAVVAGLDALGRLRANEPSVELTLKNLESDTYADDSSLHTQIAVLNKINAAGVAAARMTKDTNYVLVSLLEQQLLDATERREATVQGLNAHAAFLAQARPLLAATTADTTRALTTFRIP